MPTEGGVSAGHSHGALAGFWALIATQFQGAFSDNALKWLVSFLVLEASVSKERRDFLFVLVVPLVFAIPFLVFSERCSGRRSMVCCRSCCQRAN